MWQEFVRRVALSVLSFGFDPRRFYYSILGLPTFIASYIRIRSNHPGKNFFVCPVLSDSRMPAGTLNSAYFHMDLWAAQKVYKGKFDNIIDIGSRIDGFVGHILAFREITVSDIRPLESSIPNLRFKQMDMMSELRVTEKYDCVTSLHALEHFGLGRYGDPINIDGWKVGFENLAKLVCAGGYLLLAVPVGRERTEFNAHRVFYPQTIADYGAFLGLSLESFAIFTDDKIFHEVDDLSQLKLFDDQVYACGCFVFKSNA